MKISKRFANVGDSSTLIITAKAKQMKLNNIDVAILAAGEPDFDTPQPIKDGAIAAIQDGFTGYTPVRGINDLLQLICKKFEEDNGLKYKPENIVVSTGAKQAIYNIIQALCDEDSEVILLAPYWVSYIEMVKMTGAQPVIVDTALDDFRINAERLESAITDKTRMIIINSPNNPTGVVYDRNELKAIADIAVNHNLYCISDEIYEKIIYEPAKHISLASLDDDIRKLTLTVNGFSKTYAMTGWRIGYFAGEKDLVDKALMVQTHSTSCTSAISQKAAVAALKADKAIVEHMINSFRERRDYIADRLTKAGIEFINPEGAFYFFMNLSNVMKKGSHLSNASELCIKLLDEYRVAAIPGDGFGAESYIRISYAASMDEIKKGLDRIEEFVKKNS